MRWTNWDQSLELQYWQAKKQTRDKTSRQRNEIKNKGQTGETKTERRWKGQEGYKKKIKKTRRPEGRKKGWSHCNSNKDRILRQPDERNEHSQCRQLSFKYRQEACLCLTFRQENHGDPACFKKSKSQKIIFKNIYRNRRRFFLKLALLRKFVNKLFFFDLRVCKFQKVHGDVYSQRETRNWRRKYGVPTGCKLPKTFCTGFPELRIKQEGVSNKGTRKTHRIVGSRNA